MQLSGMSLLNITLDRKRTPLMAQVIFNVTGTGHFPLDMLRYDRCEVTEDSQDSVKAPAWGTPQWGKPRTVTCRMKRGRPTADRWISFGWRVSHVSREVV